MRYLAPLLLAFALVPVRSALPDVPEGKRFLAVDDAIETRRLMIDAGAAGAANPGGAVQVSPDGRTWVARIVEGDVTRNGAWVELITGSLESLEGAAACRTVARLFTTGLGSGVDTGGADEDTSAFSSPLRWLDDAHVTFPFSDARGIRQAVRVDVPASRIEYLTAHPTHVSNFDVGDDGVVLYSAKAAWDPAQAEAASLELLRRGAVIPANIDGHSLFGGDLTGATLYDRAWNAQWFVQDRIGSEPRPIRIHGREVESQSSPLLLFDPDGSQALVSAAPGLIPEKWDRYTNRDLRGFIVEARRDMRASNARNVQQLFLVDTRRGSVRPLWSAASTLYGVRAAWSPDGRRLLLAPTFLPPDEADARGLEGEAAVVVDVSTGRFRQLPVTLSGRQPVSALRWLDDDTVEIAEGGRGGSGERHRFRRRGREWRPVAGNDDAAAPAPAIRIELRQDHETPPRLYAVEVSTGKERMILDLNPELTRKYALGRVERIEGEIESGERWQALLFYPVDHEPGRRYPLVVQSIYGGLIGSEFTLYGFQAGAGLGPTLIAPYPGRLLANRGIFVLHFDIRMGSKVNTPQEAEVRRQGFETVIERLAREELIDRDKVGLLGFSRNGWYVEYTLTHSDFPFAAAISADNWDPSYFTQTLVGYGSAAPRVNGGSPFGEGLKGWLENTPGFGVQNIRTPLRMVGQTMGLFDVLYKWETFSRLRHLERPVEFYLMPDAHRHGAHSPQNPAQIRAVMQGSIDWFDFWLNGYEDPDPLKAEQYARWRVLREQRDAMLKEPPAPRLRWQVLEQSE